MLTLRVNTLYYSRNTQNVIEDIIDERVDIPESRFDCPGHTLCLADTGSACGSDALTGNQFRGDF